MRILLFGIIAEQAGTDRLESAAGTLSGLEKELKARIPGLDGMRYAIAVDKRIVPHDMPLSGKEEVAVLPPFAGG